MTYISDECELWHKALQIKACKNYLHQTTISVVYPMWKGYVSAYIPMCHLNQPFLKTQVGVGVSPLTTRGEINTPSRWLETAIAAARRAGWQTRHREETLRISTWFFSLDVTDQVKVRSNIQNWGFNRMDSWFDTLCLAPLSHNMRQDCAESITEVHHEGHVHTEVT